MCGLGVNAADKVVGERFATIENLSGKLFAVVSESSNKAMGIGIPNHGNGWDMYFGTYNEAYASNACYYLIEQAKGDGVTNYYYLRTYNSNGAMYTAWDASYGYFNSQTGTGGYFALGLNGRNGQDALNHAVWEITVSEGKFALKNIGTGKYLHDDEKSNTYSDPFYFTFCTLIDDPLPAVKEKYNALKNKYLAINSGLDVREAESLFNSATTVDEVQAAINELVSIFGASLTDETSLTGLITNPSFESGFTGWTNNGMATQNNSSFPGKVGTNYCEAWQPNGTKGVSQTLTLPQGLYRISANSLARGVTSAKLYAGNKEKAITIAETSNTYTFEFYVNGGGDVAIGFEGVGTGAGASWLCVDNFQLTYVQNMTAEEYATYEAYHAALDAYNEAMAAAQALNGKIPTAAYYALSQVVTANTVTDGTTDQYNANAAAINAAVANAEPLVAPYATWLTLKDQSLALATGHDKITAAINNVALYVETITKLTDLQKVNTMATAMIKNYRAWDILKNNADALVATSTTDEAARTEVADVRDAQAANISNAAVSSQEEIATLINVTIPTATATLKAKMTTYVKTAQPTNKECFDITFLIENAHFYEGEGGNKAATGWTLESGAITEHRILTHNFEAYHTPFNLSQTISGLKKGTYKVTLQGFARHDNSGPTDKTNLYCGVVDQKIKDIKDEYSTKPLTSGKPAMGDNNGEVSYTINTSNGTATVYQPNGMSGSYYFFQEENPDTHQPFYTNEVQTIISADGPLKIGFKCETNTDWVIWDNFHLYYYGSAISVTLDETNGTSYSEDIENANVTLNKTIYEGWNTVVLPFAATKAQLGADKLYAYTGDANDMLNFTEVDAIEANKPYLLKATTGSTTAKTFNNVEVKAATDLTTAGTDYDFVGTYTLIQVKEGDYILGENDFYRSAGGNKVKAYRAYIKKHESTQGSARLAIVIDGEVTAIDTLDGQPLNNAAIFNLSGQKVEKAQKGIYIQGGKKIVIK